MFPGERRAIRPPHEWLVGLGTPTAREVPLKVLQRQYRAQLSSSAVVVAGGTRPLLVCLGGFEPQHDLVRIGEPGNRLPVPLGPEVAGR